MLPIPVGIPWWIQSLFQQKGEILGLVSVDPKLRDFIPAFLPGTSSEQENLFPCRLFFLSDHRWAGPCFSLDIPTFPCWSSEMSASYKSFWNKNWQESNFVSPSRGKQQVLLVELFQALIRSAHLELKICNFF